MNIDKYLQSDGTYSDGGITHMDAEAFLCHLLGFCGCGCPDLALKYTRDILQLIRARMNADWDSIDDPRPAEYKDLWDFFPDSGAAYFAFYVLDDKGFLEHGSSVPGWLTDAGEALLEDLNELDLDDTEKQEG